MYWCNDCQAAYPDSDLKAVDASEEELWTQCGYCGGSDIESANRCRCGEWKKTSEDFCEDCKDYLTDRAEDVVEDFMKIFKTNNHWRAKEELKSWLDEIYGR